MNDQAFEIFNGKGKAPLLLLCDHASNAVPASLNRLGLDDRDFTTHIAYDIGAAELTRALATRFGAPAYLGKWSRLVVDLNRGADDPTVIMRLSDGRIIPGNRDLDERAIEGRLALYHAPYHDAVAQAISRMREKGDVPVLVSMHSFTPIWRGVPRPWEIGILWDTDGRLAKPLLKRLAAEQGLTIGDNDPYTGALENDCLYRHGTMNGLPHVLIETRQDLLQTPDGIKSWGERIGDCLQDALNAMGKPIAQKTREI